MPMNRFKSCLAAVVVALPTVLAGCGSSSDLDLATVSGGVTLNNKPVPGVVVLFQPTSGNSSSGTTDELGQYTLKFNVRNEGAIVGTHQVKIFTPTREDGSQPPEVIPAKYNKKSTLVEQVSSGQNIINFELAK